jgi:hypothetical protein
MQRRGAKGIQPGHGAFHFFWFNPAIESFQNVLQLDPACGMADWGIAFMSMGNPFAWPETIHAKTGVHLLG